MGKRYDRIEDRLADFIREQRVFFVATAAPDGRVNVSPKGMDTLRLLGANRVLWLSVTGSGNETAAHLRESNRITLMFCAFEGTPMILRLYGRGRVYHPRDPEWDELLPLFPPLPGARQIIDVDVDLVQTSCGMGVPYYAFRGDREQLNEWATRKGEDGIRQYWEDRNGVTIDGKPTGIFE